MIPILDTSKFDVIFDDDNFEETHGVIATKNYVDDKDAEFFRLAKEYADSVASKGGTNDYTKLINKPIINKKTAEGDIDVTSPITNTEMEDILK